MRNRYVPVMALLLVLALSVRIVPAGRIAWMPWMAVDPVPALAQSVVNPTQFFHIANQGTQLNNCLFKVIYALNAGSGDIDIGSPPSGRRWLLMPTSVYNGTAGTLTGYSEFKVGSTYYNCHSGSTATSLGSNVSGVFATNNALVLESTTSYSVHTSGAGLNLRVNVFEFDTSSNLRSSLLLSLSTGNNTIYTAPTGGAVLVSPQGAFPSAGIYYWNNSGGSRTIYENQVPSGGSPNSPGNGGGSNNAMGPTASVGNNPLNPSIAPTTSAYYALNAGDQISLNTDLGAGTQAAWVTVVESQ